jgi:hypothetical protein
MQREDYYYGTNTGADNNRILQETHYPQLQWLMNQHLSTLAPGWALPEHYIVSRLSHNPDQYITDPWVSERMTLCAILRQRVVGVAHLLRYKAGPEVSRYCQNAGEIDWFLAVPHEQEAAGQLLAACQRQFTTWQVRSTSSAKARKKDYICCISCVFQVHSPYRRHAPRFKPYVIFMVVHIVSNMPCKQTRKCMSKRMRS